MRQRVLDVLIYSSLSKFFGLAYLFLIDKSIKFKDVPDSIMVIYTLILLLSIIL